MATRWVFTAALLALLLTAGVAIAQGGHLQEHTMNDEQYMSILEELERLKGDKSPAARAFISKWACDPGWRAWFEENVYEALTDLWDKTPEPRSDLTRLLGDAGILENID